MLPTLDISDHEPVFAEISTSPLVTVKPPRMVPQYNRANWDEIHPAAARLNQDVLDTPPDTDVNSLWEKLSHGIRKLAQEHIPT